MANDYYTSTGNPQYGAPGASATVRSEFAAIVAGFDKLPGLSGNAGKVIVVNGTNDALIPTSTVASLTLTTPVINGGTLSGNITNSGTISGGTLSGSITNSGTISGGTISGAIHSGGTLSGSFAGSPTIAVVNVGTSLVSSGLNELGTLSNLNGSAAILSVENPYGLGAQFMSSVAAAGATSVAVRNDRTDGTAISFLFGASQVGSVTQNGSATAYNTTSDQRLKTRIGYIEYVDAARVIEKIAALWFVWKGDPDAEPEPGFFAQQVHRYAPWAVVRGHGRPGSKKFRPWQLDATKLMPFLIAYVQGQGRSLCEHERRIAALEGCR